MSKCNMSGRNSSLIRSHLNVESKENSEFMGTENKLVIARVWEVELGKMGEGGQRYKFPIIK